MSARSKICVLAFAAMASGIPLQIMGAARAPDGHTHLRTVTGWNVAISEYARPDGSKCYVGGGYDDCAKEPTWQMRLAQKFGLSL